MHAQQIVNGSPLDRNEATSRKDLRIENSGSGSDYTPFAASRNRVDEYRLWRRRRRWFVSSIYDSFDHYTRFNDPGFKYGIALSKVCGHAVLRLANADTLPFEFTNFTDTVGQYINEVTRLTDTMRDDTKRINQLISSGMWKSVQNPTDGLREPQMKDEVPQINFDPLKNALTRLKDSSSFYQRVSTGKQPNPAAQKALDEILYKAERVLTRSEGLPRRDWFRHQIYAPGFYTGYGVKTLPGVREAIEQRDWREANEQILIVSKVLENFAAEIDKAAKMF